MKKIALFLLISVSLNAQVQIQPQEIQTTMDGTFDVLSGLNSTFKKPYWIGISSYPHFYLDSSNNYKIGVGVGLKKHGLSSSPYHFDVHAKLHVRHAGSSGSDFNNQAGPHLLLDEATSNRSAVLRFRQSTNEINPFNGQNMQVGKAWWDIRAFANATSDSDDFIRFFHKNKGAVMTLTGDGKVGVNTENPTVSLEVNGFTKLGSDAPGIKTATIDFLMPTTDNTCNQYLNSLPVNQDKILQISAQSIDLDWNPSDALGEAYSYPPFNNRMQYAYYYELTQQKGINVCLGNGADLGGSSTPSLSSTFVRGDTLRVFIIYKE